MNNYGYVYKTTNILNNKVYVGQHKGNFNPNYFGSGKLIHQAVKKYGHIHFKLEIVAEASNQEELDNLEKFYIAEARKLLSVYNLSDGGYSGSGGTRFHKADCRCVACKAKRHELLGTEHPMFGKHQTKKFSEVMSGDHNPARRPQERERKRQKMLLSNPMQRSAVVAKLTGEGNGMFGKSRPDFSAYVKVMNKADNPMRRPEVLEKRRLLK